MKKRLAVWMAAGFLICLTACSPGNGPTGEISDGQVPSIKETEQETTETPDITEEPSQEMSARDRICSIFLTAMTEMTPQIEVDVSDMDWQYGAENDLKNIYYEALAKRPELKYTYRMEAAVSENTAVCSFSYMPYKTGAYEDGIPEESHVIDSLYSAKVMAQSMNSGIEEISVAITNPDLAVEDLQKALKQAGYGWISYSLSPDGTRITASAPVGMTLEECGQRINESFALCSDVVEDTVTDGMSDLEKIRAVYCYVTKNTSYDFRYYSEPESMPYESTVALGALRDGVAICGGYAQAFEMLLDRLGIENYTVSGTSKGEYHMWNYVMLDGAGYYCDPTADRGANGIDRHFMLTGEELAALGGYTWDEKFVEAMPRSSLDKR